MTQTIKIDPVLKSFLPPMDKDTYDLLEQSIKDKKGATDAIITWKGKDVIVDGYNRYDICTRLDLPFKVDEQAFKNVNEVKMFMLERQLARRNLTELALKKLRGTFYRMMKKDPQSNLTQNSKGQPATPGSTAKVVADKFGTSERTVKRDAVFAEGLDTIREEKGDQVATDILAGKQKVNKKDVEAVGKAKNATAKKAAVEKAMTPPKTKAKPKGKVEVASITVSKVEYDLTTKIIDAARLSFTGNSANVRTAARESLGRLVGELDATGPYTEPASDAEDKPTPKAKAKPPATPKPKASIKAKTAAITAKYND